MAHAGMAPMYGDSDTAGRRLRRTEAAAALLFLCLGACGGDAPAVQPAATVANAVPESELTSVTLSAAAAERLGIETATVDSASVAPTRSVGGEVIVPPGRALVLTAPVAGTVLPPENGAVPAPGARLARRQPILRLVALPPDRDLLRLQESVTVAEARLRAAEAEAERIERLWADRLVSARDRERAVADLAAARATHAAAAAQQSMVQSGADPAAQGLGALLVTAPEAGVLQSLSVAPGQSVAAGAPLAEVVQLDRLWVRVPIYAGEAAGVDRVGDAAVQRLGGASSGVTLVARPIAAPPSANPTAASVDLFYEVDVGAGVLRPGERVRVTIPLEAAAEHVLVVPLAAVVYDINGGAWVYERTAPLTFVRRRVEIARVSDGLAVLVRGPAPGTVVVTAGVAELFGTEFGTGH